jgi:thiol-disulfide isomerase/thioredoxin
MMGRMRLPVRAVLAAVLPLATAAALPAQNIGLPIGARPEAVQLEDLSGRTVDLGQIIGSKPMVVEFWATWCPLCERLQPRMNAAHERYGDQVEFVIIAVGVNQTVRSVSRHMEDHPVPGLVLFDARGRAARAFMAPTTSYVVVLDAAGKVVYTGTDANQDIMGAVQRALASSSPERS